MKRKVFIMCAGLFVAASLFAGCTDSGNTETVTVAEDSPLNLNETNPDRAGFDEATNVEYTFGGVTISVPSYWEEKSLKENVVNLTVTEKDSGGKATLLILEDVDYDGDKSDLAAAAEKIVPEIEAEVTEGNARMGSEWETEYNGFPAYCFDYQAISNDDIYYEKACILYNAQSDTLVGLYLVQNNNLSWDLVPDYEKVLESIRPVG